MDQLPEIRLLRYFAAVAEELHFGRAAEALSISEPVLSRQIRELERQLGASLFVRSKRRVQLTDAGRVLQVEAQRVLEQLQHALDAVQRASRGQIGQVRVGFVPSAVNHILPDVVAGFRRDQPSVKVTLRETTRADMVEGIGRDRLDVGFVHRPVGERATDGRLAEETLFTEPYAAVLPSGHRLSRRKSLSLAELADEDFVFMPRAVLGEHGDYLLDACRRAGFTPRVVQEASRSATILGLVAAGVGIGLLSYSHRASHQAGIAFVPIVELQEAMMMVWDDARVAPATARFLELSRSTATRYERAYGRLATAS